MISFWMPHQQQRVGRGPVDKKVFLKKKIICQNVYLKRYSSTIIYTAFSGCWFIFSMSRYVPVSTKMDSEDHYHSPYDTNDLDSDVSLC